MRLTYPTLVSANVSAGQAGDIDLEVAYYDFSASHSDFTGLGYVPVRQPSYVASPYGAWLSRSNSPTTDSFSDWFRERLSDNHYYNSTLTLTYQSGSHHR